MKLLVMKQTDKGQSWEGFKGNIVFVQQDDLQAFVQKLSLILPEMVPGVKNIAFPHIKELNEVMLEVERLEQQLK